MHASIRSSEVFVQALLSRPRSPLSPHCFASLSLHRTVLVRWHLIRARAPRARQGSGNGGQQRGTVAVGGDYGSPMGPCQTGLSACMTTAERDVMHARSHRKPSFPVQNDSKTHLYRKIDRCRRPCIPKEFIPSIVRPGFEKPIRLTL